ncbi:MAG TPA: helix-turn-helix transcriptional regulator [Pseudorhodoplanes sp.]|nr:helix-turn-helix transcriptional regulator [Pseudorhodoplanes sp.]
MFRAAIAFSRKREICARVVADATAGAELSPPGPCYNHVEVPMATTSEFAEIAALTGDPARAAMLQALMDGRALTATELASVGSVAPQTASGHLSRLLAAGLISVEKQGRHRYHRLASPAVARMIESIMQVASGQRRGGSRTLATGPRDSALRAARTCYDHLAGRLGVRIADALIGRRRIELACDAGLVTPAGIKFFGRIGIGEEILAGEGRRVLCRPCLDWSERRPHLAGALGAALCSHSLRNGWIRRLPGTRAVAVTPKGTRIFREEFGVRLD